MQEIDRYAGLVISSEYDYVTIGIYRSKSQDQLVESLFIDSSFPKRLVEVIVAASEKDEKIGVGLGVLHAPIKAFSSLPYFLNGIAQLGSFEMRNSRDGQEVLFSDMPEDVRKRLGANEAGRLVSPSMTKALCTFYYGSIGSPEITAIALSKICSIQGVYSYARSRGYAHSAGDVAQVLKGQLKGLPSVVYAISADDFYVVKPTSMTPLEVERGDVFLEYELGKVDYPYLGVPDDCKMGLLHVCRKYSLCLLCSHGSDGEVSANLLEDINEEACVWPA